MSEQEWNAYLQQLAQVEHTPNDAHCVSCWYECHDTPFPAQDSSSLCGEHTEAIRQAYSARKGVRA